jgi:simple sugar transport system ATP-binding protein
MADVDEQRPPAVEPSPVDGETPLLEARDIHKHFGRVYALRGANFAVYPSEVVALIGDNGAGKSTLVKILAGVLARDSGEILVNGERVEISSALDARRHGIETVYQDLALAPDLEPSANLFLGREIRMSGPLGALGVLNNREMRRRTAQAFETLGVGIPSTTAPVANFSGGQRQGVAVSRAVTWANRVVFMDEPTAALGVVQTRKVLDLIRRVRDQGISVVLISHNMPEVLEVSDRVEVLRLGRRVARFRKEDATMEGLVGAMTGAIEHGEAA